MRDSNLGIRCTKQGFPSLIRVVQLEIINYVRRRLLTSHSATEIKNEWSYTSILSSVFLDSFTAASNIITCSSITMERKTLKT